MKVGDIGVDLLLDGTMKIDGGAFFGVVPRALWERQLQPDHRNRVTLNLNCPLLRSAGKNIIVDTGLGTKHPSKRQEMYGLDSGKLVGDLRERGLEPADIDYVVFTHLHWDHAGGASYYAPSGILETTFPRAQYLAQRADWEEATHPNERNRAGYYDEDLEPLQEAQQIELLDGDTEIVPGVWCKLTGGHTSGHQIAMLEVAGQKACFLGDLVPTVSHLPLPWSQGYDLYPIDVLNAKRDLLDQAAAEDWLIIFDHEMKSPAGRLSKSVDGRLGLRSEPI